MRRIFLIRGTPGAGKTTFSKLLNAIAVSSDDYDGDCYSHIHDILAIRRKWCLDKVELLLQTTDSDIAVHNVFPIEEHLIPYYELAEKYNCQVTTLIIENRHGNKSVYDMPEENVKELANKFEIKLTPELDTIIFKTCKCKVKG